MRLLNQVLVMVLMIAIVIDVISWTLTVYQAVLSALYTLHNLILPTILKDYDWLLFAKEETEAQSI